MSPVGSHLAITGDQALAVVIATTVLYALFLVVLRLWGHRVRSSPATASVAATLVVGPVVGRSMLGDVPNLSGGLVALTTLVVLELLARAVRGAVLPARSAPQATLVVAGGRVRADALAGAGLTPSDLHTLLRRAGVLHLADVGLAVLETDGRLTVVPAGSTVDAALVADVAGAAGLSDAVLHHG